MSSSSSHVGKPRLLFRNAFTKHVPQFLSILVKFQYNLLDESLCNQVVLISAFNTKHHNSA